MTRDQLADLIISALCKDSDDVLRAYHHFIQHSTTGNYYCKNCEKSRTEINCEMSEEIGNNPK